MAAPQLPVELSLSIERCAAALGDPSRLKDEVNSLKANGDGIYGSVPVTEPYNYQLATQSRDVLYLHFRWGEKLHWPSWGRYWIPGVKRRVVDAWIPATGEKVPFEWRDGSVGITVPAKYPEPFGTVALRMA